jgi:cob(I)alamin adenosyltransferase
MYTGRGDDGTTGLLGPGRVPKYDDRPETYGIVDEATSALGLAKALSEDPRIKDLAARLQRDLYSLMAEVAMPPESVQKMGHQIGPEHVAWIESEIQKLDREVPLPKEFILPGATVAGAALDLARAIVRTAERRAVTLAHDGHLANPALLTYLNRASTLLFFLARFDEQGHGRQTELAKGNAPRRRPRKT